MAVKNTITGLDVKVYTVTGPASYSTGGITHNASADFSSVLFVDPVVKTRGSLAPCEFEIAVNVTQAGTEALGQCAVKIVRGRYDKATMGDPSSLPSGVTQQTVKFAAGTTTGSSHVHTINHDHPAVTSANPTNDGTLGVLLAAGGGPMRDHQHSFNVAAFTGNSGSSTHAHERSFEYDHIHPQTTAVTDLTATELAATTNISTTEFWFIVYGFGKS